MISSREHKGKSLIDFPTDYTVFDIETTGLDPYWSSVIEIGAVRVRNRQIVSEWSTLIKPTIYMINDDDEEVYVDEFIEELTGITNEMLEQAPDASDILGNFFEFIGDDVLLGHNVHFDINFVYDLAQKNSTYLLKNDFVDLLRLVRKIFPSYPNHRLQTIAEQMGIEKNIHRSIADCLVTQKAFEKTRDYIEQNSIDYKLMWRNNRHNGNYRKLDLREIVANVDEIDEDSPFFKKKVVFTGTLEKMQRKDAAQIVVNLGGECQNGVNKETNLLILGNNDYNPLVKDGKSSKQKKAEELKEKGQDIEILSENVFYDMIFDM